MSEGFSRIPNRHWAAIIGFGGLLVSPFLASCGHGTSEYEDVTVTGWAIAEKSILQRQLWADDTTPEIESRICEVDELEISPEPTEAVQTDPSCDQKKENEFTEQSVLNFVMETEVNIEGVKVKGVIEEMPEDIYRLSGQHRTGWTIVTRGECDEGKCTITRISNPELGIFFTKHFYKGY